MSEFEVLSTHELIQQAHNKNANEKIAGHRARVLNEMEAPKLDDMQAIRLMLQAIMDKLKGVEAYIRQHDLKYQPRTYTGEAQKDKPIVSQQLSDPLARPSQHPEDSTEANFRDGEKPLHGQQVAQLQGQVQSEGHGVRDRM